MGGVGGAHLHSMSRGSVAGRSAEGTTLASSASVAAAALVAAVSGGGEGGGQDGDRGDGEGRDAASQDDIAAMSAIQLRRQVLMDNLIAMGFPVEWSIRYEEESKLRLGLGLGFPLSGVYGTKKSPSFRTYIQSFSVPGVWQLLIFTQKNDMLRRVYR